MSEKKKSFVMTRREMLKLSSLAAGGLALAACTPAAPKPTEQVVATQAPAVTEPVKLTMWTYPGDELFLDAMFKLYQDKNPNVSLEIVKLELADSTQKMVTAMVAGSGLPDVADIEQGWFRKFCYGPGIIDLSPYLLETSKDEMPKFCWEAGLSPDKAKVLFLYYSIGIAVIHYRRSLFKAAGLPEDPEGVKALISKDWKTTLDTGAKIAKEGGPWMFEAAGTVFGMYRDQFNPVWFDEATQKFLINTPAMLDGLNLALDTRTRGLDAKLGQWTPEWETTFKMGTVATYPSGDWLVILLKAYGGEETKGDWGMVPVPGTSGASAGGSLFCAFEQSKYKDESAKLLNFLTFDLAAQLTLVDFYNFPILKKAWDDPKMSEPVEWYAGQQTRLISAEVAKKLSDRVYTPYDDQCNSITSTEVTNVLDQGKDPQQALADAQATAESQIELKS